jgi:hypothetical protein
MNKAMEIAKLLEQGYPVKTIKKLAKASESYIYSVKKELAEMPEETGKTTILSVDNTVYPTDTPKPGEFIQADTNVDAILNERGSRYGNFLDHARITQNIKCAMENSRNWPTLPVDTREALEMVAHKIGRMLNGDPEYVDNVVDIIGYMQLVLDRMNGKAERGIST